MPIHASRRTVLTAAACGMTTLLDPRIAGTGLAANAFAGFRVVRAVPGEPARPEITLPSGYAFVPGGQYQAVSRAEFCGFIQGARDDAGVDITLRWPKQRITAVIAGERRLPLRPDPADPDRLSFTLPVYRTSPAGDSPTVQVWSYLSGLETGLYWHVEHNDPDRAAGYWATAVWPVTQVRAVVAYMLAAEVILRESGLVAQARGRRHFFALMGFETNNLLHQDNPPHWHLSYYPGPTMGAARATVPHFWVDALGRTFYNGQDVQGSGRTPYRVGDPAPIYDAEGSLMLTTTIRADGGLDIEAPTGPRYSIVSPDGVFAGTAQILRAGVLWRTVSADDDVRAGVLGTDVTGTEEIPVRKRITYQYDPLTGPVFDTRPS